MRAGNNNEANFYKTHIFLLRKAQGICSVAHKFQERLHRLHKEITFPARAAMPQICQIRFQAFQMEKTLRECPGCAAIQT